MNRRIPTALLISFALILVTACSEGVQAQTYTHYKIQLNTDGSAVWTITQVSGINGTIDTWVGFQEKVATLLAASETHAHRPMSVDVSSLQMTTSITSTNSKTTNYIFTWLNFSSTDDGQVNVGDVFAVPGFFNLLYGDGGLQVNYPPSWMVKSVAPTPDQRDDSSQMLQWLGTQYFATDKPSILFNTQKSSLDVFQLQTALLIGVFSVIAVVVASSFFVVYRRKKKRGAATLPFPPITPMVETEEEKVLRVIRLNGGSLYQSAITEQCHFSKAKTSQLLTALEAKGIVRRYKKGRDKIVNLIEQAKGR